MKLYSLNGYTFRDFAIIPGTSPKRLRPHSRDTRLQSYQLTTTIRGIELPLIWSANMETVTASVETMVQFAQAGILPVLHQFGPLNKRVKILKKVLQHTIETKKYPHASIFQKKPLVAAAVGYTHAVDESHTLLKEGIKVIVIDTFNAYTRSFQEKVHKIVSIRNQINKNSIIVAGNVATAKGVAELIKTAKVDAVKVGTGSGTACGTAPAIAVHVPQMTALLDIYPYAKKNNIYIISDGGIKDPYDFIIALTISDAVMMGGVLAQTIESSAPKITIGTTQYALYRGSASHKERTKRAHKYTNHILRPHEKLVPEGFEIKLPVVGSVYRLSAKYRQSLINAMHMVGVSRLKDFKKYSRLIYLQQNSQLDIKTKMKNLYSQ